jgi:hypothetical protein
LEKKLSFESIVPNLFLKTRPNGRFDYTPQDSIFKDTTLKFYPNIPLSISLQIDSNLTSNRYQWYRNGQIFGSPSSSNIVNISSLSNASAGIYTCTISNQSTPDLKLYSRRITLIGNSSLTATAKTMYWIFPASIWKRIRTILLKYSTDGDKWFSKQHPTNGIGQDKA